MSVSSHPLPPYGHSIPMNGMNGEPVHDNKHGGTIYANKDYNNCCASEDSRHGFSSTQGKDDELQVIKVESPSSPATNSLYKGPLDGDYQNNHSQHFHNEGHSPEGTSLPRKWEFFPGNNRFFCDGRVMTSPSIRFCVLSFGLILMTFLLFLIFDGPFLAERLTIAIPIVGSVLFVSVIVNMAKTSLSDPGILPRASQQEWEHVERSYMTNEQSRPPPRTKDIVVNGQVVKSKFCFTCKMFRPPRASHCGVCDNCVDRFDHHCPFLGNCIGKRNYRSFYAFIVSLSFLAVFVLSCSIAHLALISKERGNFLEALKESPTSAVVVVVSFFGMWTVLGLSGFHTYLIAVEQTTNEDIKGLFGRASVKNPFSRGNFCQNCCFVLCGPAQPSLIDSRGFATADFVSSLPKKIESNGVSQPSKCQNLNLQASIKTGPNCVEGGNNQQGISKVHQQQPLMYQSQLQHQQQQQNQQPVQLSSPTSIGSGGNLHSSPTVIPNSSVREMDFSSSADGMMNRPLGEATSESMRNLYSSIEEDPRISPDPVTTTAPKSRTTFMNSMLQNGNCSTSTVYGPNQNRPKGFFTDDFDDPTVLHHSHRSNHNNHLNMTSASLDNFDYDYPDDPIGASNNTVSNTNVNMNSVSGRRSNKKIKSGSKANSNSNVNSSSAISLSSAGSSNNASNRDRDYNKSNSRCDNTTNNISIEEFSCPSLPHNHLKGSTRLKNSSGNNTKKMGNNTMINSPLHLDTIM